MEYAFPYAFDLTEAQYDRLLSLVINAQRSEEARASRMIERGPEAHSVHSIGHAKTSARELAELEAALFAGSRGATDLSPEPAA